jgi:hypothetical protein
MLDYPLKVSLINYFNTGSSIMTFKEVAIHFNIGSSITIVREEALGLFTVTLITLVTVITPVSKSASADTSTTLAPGAAPETI